MEDRASIEALLTEYAWLVDHDRSNEVQQLCTSDAVNIAPATHKARRARHQISNARIEAHGDLDRCAPRRQARPPRARRSREKSGE